MAKLFLEQYNKFGERETRDYGRYSTVANFVDVQSTQTPDGVPLTTILRSSEVIYDADAISSSLGKLASLDDVSGKYFGSDVVTADKVVDGTITNQGYIPSNSIGQSELAINSVPTSSLASGAITARSLEPLNDANFTSGAITNAQIEDDSLDSFANGVTEGKLDGGAITLYKLASNTFVTADFDDATISGFDLPYVFANGTTISSITSITVNSKGITTACSGS